MENNIVDNIKQEFKIFEDKKKVMVEELRKQFPVILAPLFEKSKIINSIGWTQYTPYFNDGDECTFCVHKNDLYINKVYSYDSKINISRPTSYLQKITSNEELEKTKELGLKYYPNSPYYNNPEIGKSGLTEDETYNKEEGDIYNSFRQVLNDVPDEIYKDLFGDHVEITIHKDGKIEVETCEHD